MRLLSFYWLAVYLLYDGNDQHEKLDSNHLSFLLSSKLCTAV
jgi:hypothetical protein